MALCVDIHTYCIPSNFATLRKQMKCIHSQITSFPEDLMIGRMMILITKMMNISLKIDCGVLPFSYL
jgi:hypothetical protein